MHKSTPQSRHSKLCILPACCLSSVLLSLTLCQSLFHSFNLSLYLCSSSAESEEDVVEVVPRGLHAAHHVLVQQLQQHCNNPPILNCLAEANLAIQLSLHFIPRFPLARGTKQEFSMSNNIETNGK